MLLSSQSLVRTVTCTLVVLSLASSLSAGAADNSQVQRGDAALVARQVVSRLLTRSVRGKIEFDLSIEDTSDGNSVIASQRGVMYINEPTGVRLDLWLTPDSEYPIICAVDNGRVWMSWQDSGTVHEAEYPIQPEQPSGWLGQCGAQAGQAIAFRHILTDFLLGDGTANAIIAASFEGSQLQITIGPHGLGNADRVSSGTIDAEYSKEFGAFLSNEISVNGTRVVLEDYAAFGSDIIMPQLISVYPSAPTDRRDVFKVRHVMPMDAGELGQELTTPRERADLNSFPNPFVGTVLYAADGSESFYSRW